MSDDRRMNMAPRIASLLLLLAAASACAVTVVEEGHGGSGGAGTSTAVSGTSVVATATGTGGVSTSTATGTGGVTTSVVSSGVTAVSSGVTTGVGGNAGACTNDPSDVFLVANTDVFHNVVIPCGMMFVGQDPQELDCIVGKSGLTVGCATCYDDDAKCIIMNCLSMCISNQAAPQCTQCLAQRCDPSFMICSGLSHGP
jgi:hypothetical protein